MYVSSRIAKDHSRALHEANPHRPLGTEGSNKKDKSSYVRCWISLLPNHSPRVILSSRIQADSPGISSIHSIDKRRSRRERKCIQASTTATLGTSTRKTPVLCGSTTEATG
jgi:hypothetical protein